MTFLARLFTVGLLLAASPQLVQAHCLVFRAQTVSKKASTATSAADNIQPSTTSLILVVDIEKEYQTWSWNSNSALSTETNVIRVGEGTTNTFAYGSEKSADATAYFGDSKFGFFKTGGYFYLFSTDSENFGLSGMDYGSLYSSGPCTVNAVNIGGNSRLLRVPLDFTAIQNRADSGQFKTKVLNVSVDLVLTAAVNDYLYANSFITAAGATTTAGVSGSVYDTASTVSQIVGKAKAYLYNTYFPNNGYTQVAY